MPSSSRSGSPFSFRALRARNTASVLSSYPSHCSGCLSSTRAIICLTAWVSSETLGGFTRARTSSSSRDRARRTRNRSICASATRRARSSRDEFAPSPAIIRATRSTSSATLGSTVTGMASPCRNAFREAADLPASVFGPVLRRAFARLARTRAVSFIRRPPAWDLFEFHVFDLGRGLAQTLRQHVAVAVDFPQHHIAAAFCLPDHPLDALDRVEL